MTWVLIVIGLLCVYIAVTNYKPTVRWLWDKACDKMRISYDDEPIYMASSLVVGLILVVPFGIVRFVGKAFRH